MRQKLLWLGERDSVTSVAGKAPRAKPVRLAEKPDRVWTLYGDYDEQHKPQLPFAPMHLHGAFMEDYVHDWNWRGGVFRYYSRVVNGPTWVLLEYKK